MSALAARAEHAWPGRSGRPAQWWPALLIAATLCVAAFLAGGGLSLSRMTATEMALTLGSGAVLAGAVMFTGARERTYGLWPVGLLLAFTALTAASIVWSVQPDDSFRDAGRMLAYSAFFGASVALVRAIPARWPAVLGGVTLAAVIVCGYALLTKIFPDQFDASDIYARLRAPYSYWNATGLTAAMGAICCLWLGARRSGHAVISALAYPAMGLMLVTLMLAYSRGALIALALGIALWFCIVPLRLRGAAVLLTGAIAAGVVVAWDFSNHALSTDNIALGARTSAGHELGALLAAMLLSLTAVGLAIGFITGRRAPARRSRRWAGAVLLSLLALAAAGVLGAATVSHRGLTGNISHAFHTFTDPNARVPNTPGRLTAVASVRARYWDEALKVFKAHPVLGAGAEGYATARLRYRTAPIPVRQAHGFIVQTLADLGLVGLALTLALLVTWMAAAGRCTRPFNRGWRRWRRWINSRPWRSSSHETDAGHETGSGPSTAADPPAPYTPERIGLLTMLCLVVVFGIHSLVDWTWYVPGDACVALLCAGWIAGRGPLSRSPSLTPAPGVATYVRRFGAGDGGSRWTDRRAAGLASAALIAALLAAWAQWQPQRSVDSSQLALSLLGRNSAGATAAADAAIARDPLSEQALFTLATVQRATGHAALARATLQRAVRLQPSNPQTWLTLGEYDLTSDPKSAVNELAAAIYLNPESIAPEAIAKGNQEAIAIQNAYVQALRASAAPAG